MQSPPRAMSSPSVQSPPHAMIAKVDDASFLDENLKFTFEDDESGYEAACSCDDGASGSNASAVASPVSRRDIPTLSSMCGRVLLRRKSVFPPAGHRRPRMQSPPRAMSSTSVQSPPHAMVAKVDDASLLDENLKFTFEDDESWYEAACSFDDDYITSAQFSKYKDTPLKLDRTDDASVHDETSSKLVMRQDAQAMIVVPSRCKLQ